LEVAALLGVLALAAQAAGQEGTVTGTLTLDGVPVALTHVYATAQPGFFDAQAEDVHVLLSSQPLSDEDRADAFRLIRLAREGKLAAVEVVLDQGGSPIGGSLFAKPFAGMVSAAGMHEFTRERFDRSGVAGRLAVATPHSFMGVTWQYEARFAAPIPRPPTAEEVAAALRTPPAAAASAYLAAARGGELAAFLATLTEDAAAGYRGKDGLERLQQLAADLPADSRVVGLVPQADGTVLVSVEGHRPEDGMVIGHSLKLVNTAGAWKVGR